VGGSWTVRYAGPDADLTARRLISGGRSPIQCRQCTTIGEGVRDGRHLTTALPCGHRLATDADDAGDIRGCDTCGLAGLAGCVGREVSTDADGGREVGGAHVVKVTGRDGRVTVG